MPEPLDDYEHPFDAHARRSPMTGAAVRVVAIQYRPDGRAEEVAEGLINLLAAAGRRADRRGLTIGPGDSIATAFEAALADADAPLVLITTATEPWAETHLSTLLAAIDTCDHAIWRRPATGLARIIRWVMAWRWRLLFAVPVEDVHSPCRLHRREALAAIPLQSRSDFLDVEILAKATF